MMRITKIMLNHVDLMNDINKLDLKRNKQRSQAIPIRDGSRGEKLTEKKSGRSLNEDDMRSIRLRFFNYVLTLLPLFA